MVTKKSDTTKTIKKLKATKNKVKKIKEKDTEVYNVELPTEMTEEEAQQLVQNFADSLKNTEITDEEAEKLTKKDKSKKEKEIHWEPVAKTQEEIKKNNNFYAKIKDFFHF